MKQSESRGRYNLHCVYFQTARPVLANQEVVDHMVKDVEKLDNGNSARQTVHTKTEKECEDGFDNECK